jgi:ABC-type polysaccharide/polyol phosphate export permease
MVLVTDLWGYRGLIGNLAQRELKARYKRSVLGWAWSLINPATTLLTYAVVFGTLLKVQPPVAGNGTLKNFALYLFCGLVVWNFFTGVVNGSMGALVGSGPLLRKVYFPAECPVIANTLVALAQTAIEVGILLALMVIFGNVSWTFLLVPVLVALLILFSVGLGLVFSLVNVYFRDVQYLVAVGLNVLFYATPIVYTIDLVENNAPTPIKILVRLNPLTQFVGAMRDLVYDLECPSFARFGGIALASVLTAWLGWLVFRRFASRVSEEL